MQITYTLFPVVGLDFRVSHLRYGRVYKRLRLLDFWITFSLGNIAR